MVKEISVLEISILVCAFFLIGVLMLNHYGILDKISFLMTNSSTLNVSLGKCLTESGAVFYGAIWCSHCADQKRLFGNDLKNVNYTECWDGTTNSQNQLCTNLGIRAYPTWKINNTLYEGVKSLEELSRLSGCNLTITKGG